MGSYRHGKLHGPYREHHENGQLALEGAFDRGAPDGTWALYSEAGKLARRLSAKRGTLTGKLEAFAPNGQTYQTLEFDEGGRLVRRDGALETDCWIGTATFVDHRLDDRLSACAGNRGR